MIDADRAHDTVMYYCNNTQDDIAYRDVFEWAAQTFPFEVINVLSKETPGLPFESGFVTKDMLARRTPDFLERVWYISGPPGMVAAYGNLLRDCGVPHSHIKKDFFPGAV
jgi:ferredoxin-NADP reductase